MASLQGRAQGRDFTAEELLGRHIRIEGPVPKKGKEPLGFEIMVIADDEMVGNVARIELVLDPCELVTAKLTLIHPNQPASGDLLTEEVTLSRNVDVSLTASVWEVQ